METRAQIGAPTVRKAMRPRGEDQLAVLFSPGRGYSSSLYFEWRHGMPPWSLLVMIARKSIMSFGVDIPLAVDEGPESFLKGFPLFLSGPTFPLGPPSPRCLKITAFGHTNRGPLDYNKGYRPVSLSPGGATLAGGGRDGKVLLWDDLAEWTGAPCVGGGDRLWRGQQGTLPRSRRWRFGSVGQALVSRPLVVQ